MAIKTQQIEKLLREDELRVCLTDDIKNIREVVCEKKIERSMVGMQKREKCITTTCWHSASVDLIMVAVCYCIDWIY